MNRLSTLKAAQARVDKETIWTGVAKVDAEEMINKAAKEEVDYRKEWLKLAYTTTLLSDLEEKASEITQEAIGLALSNQPVLACNKLVELSTINKVLNYARNSKYSIAE